MQWQNTDIKNLAMTIFISSAMIVGVILFLTYIIDKNK